MLAYEQPQQKSLNGLTHRRLQEYGIFNDDEIPEIAQRYKLKDITADEARSAGFSNTADGIYITYPTEAQSRIRFNRTGFQAQQELGKYGQRPHTPPALYFPPTLPQHHIDNQEIPVLIVEGEFKTIIADYIMNHDLQKPDIICCGLGGVWSWRRGSTGEELISGFDFLKSNRQVYIAYDQDNPVKPQVQHALSKLLDKLMGTGAKCSVLSWPSQDGKGLDDYLVNKPGPRDALLSLLTYATLPHTILRVLKMNGTYVYDRVQDAVWDFNAGSYVKPQTFKAHYFTDTVAVPRQTVVQGATKVVNKSVGLGDYWLSCPARATCEGKAFAPGAERLVPKSADSDVKRINTWTNWGAGSDLRKLQPIQGDVTPWLEWMEATFGRNKLIPNAPACNPVEYIIKRLAWIFQHPTIKHPTWIYLIGKPMQGKSKLINMVTRMVGNNYTSHIDETALSSTFSEWRAEKLLIAFDDVAIVERSRIKQVLKRMTTEQTARVNRKYEREYTAYSFETFFFATNSLDALLDHDDRRAIVLEAKCPWSQEEWSHFDRWAGTPSSYNALLHYLMYEVKIDDSFLTLHPPMTQLRELVMESAESGWDEFLNMLAAPRPLQYLTPASQEVRKFKPTIMTPEMLKALYALINGPQEPRSEIKTATLTTKLQRFGASRVHPSDSDDKRARVFVMTKQTTAWCWDAEYADITNAELNKHLFELSRKMPELFSGYNTTANKF